MTKLIINADDCGINQTVDACIQHFIDVGKLSSTTIMANMEDYAGALSLYKTYGESISFGIHLNMTEGRPLLRSQELLDFGITKELGDEIFFSGTFPYWRMPRQVQLAVKKELDAQIIKVLDDHVVPSHIDSHHHIHTYPSMLSIIPLLLKNHRINRVRRMRNYGFNIFNYYIRSAWLPLIKIQNMGVCSTQYFSSIRSIKSLHMSSIKSIELMCHPGGYDADEYDFMECMRIPEEVKLITYNNM